MKKLAICALTLLAFGASLWGTFQYDDFGLLADPGITSPSGWTDVFTLTQTRPLSWLTFWANYQFGGEAPFGYHLVNLLLHATVVYLLLDFLTPFLNARAAQFAVVLFAVHPVLGEPVNYISARPVILSALFSLLALKAWTAQRGWHAVWWFALAMLSKEECAALPLLFLLFDWIRTKAIRLAPLAVAFAVAGALGLRVVWAANVVKGSQAGSQAGVSPFGYFLAQGTVLWRYIGLLFVPVGFTPDHEIAIPPAWLAALAWAALLAIVVLLFRHIAWANAAFWTIAGFLLFLPSSSIFPAADLMADRRMYLPMLAFSAALGLVLSRFPNLWMIGVAAVLSAISIHSSLVWRTPESLWTAAVAQAPTKARPRIQLARAVEPVRGLALLKEAQSFAADDPTVAAEQGRLLLATGQPDAALTAFGRALALDPSDARAIGNRGAALLALGQVDAARADFERALAKDPCQFDALVNLRRIGHGRPPGTGCRFSASQLALFR